MSSATMSSEDVQSDHEPAYFPQQGNYEEDIVVDEELVEQLMVSFPLFFNS